MKCHFYHKVFKLVNFAYRAETAMANTLQEYISKKDEARSLVRQIFMTDTDKRRFFKELKNPVATQRSSGLN